MLARRASSGLRALVHLLICCSPLLALPQDFSPRSQANSKVSGNLAQLPMVFEPNEGQPDIFHVLTAQFHDPIAKVSSSGVWFAAPGVSVLDRFPIVRLHSPELKRVRG